MFKVMIIDDEPVIRKGLKNIINWSRFDCAVCGEAADGIEGAELIRELLPDIIFTDIRMPEVDGLSMLREIRELIPDSKVIILTGYRDFDYAQEAVKLGAFDFIMKPSKIEELTAVVKRAVKELKFQRDKVEEIDKLRKLFEQNIPILREKLCCDIIYGINTNSDEIHAKMELFNIHIDRFRLIVTEIEDEELQKPEKDQYNEQLYQFGIINTFDEVFSEDFKIISIALNSKRTAFIVQPHNAGSDYLEVINNRCAYMQDIIHNCFGFTVSMALSTEGIGAMELPAKLRECQEVLEHKFYIGNNALISYMDMNSFFKYTDFSVLDEQLKALMIGVKTGNEAAVREKASEIFKHVGSMGGLSGENLVSFYWNAISAINDVRLSVAEANDEKDGKYREIGSLKRMLEKTSDKKEMNGLLEEIAVSVAAKVNSYNNRSLKLILRKAIDYLNTHFSEPVTLNEVAESTCVSTFYISRMFKKELGKNFVDYLNGIRVDKARELLRDVKYKTYEVAELVGIPDAHYFSKIFRRYTGMTPTEFREQNNTPV
ncbi:MAG: response regulator [Clostridiales bacterium]|nr:response regulator [Clostridiales bacterium]